MLETEGTKTQSNIVWIIVAVTKARKRESSDPEIYLTARVFVSTLWRQELRFGRELELRPLHKTEEDTENSTYQRASVQGSEKEKWPVCI